MQYHLNGFKPGNIEIPDASRVPDPIPPFKALPHKMDVLIVGCGPAGLTLARQLAEFPDSHANQALASGYSIGQRFPTVKAVRVADGRPTHLGHLVKADGRWRVFIFADAAPLHYSESEFAKLVNFLETSNQSPLNQYTTEGDEIDSVIDVYSVLQQQDVSLEEMPDLLWPAKGKYQLRDYEKVFCNTSDFDVFSNQGINTEQGCMVIVRPDQHIANILPLNQHTELADFFANIMI